MDNSVIQIRNLSKHYGKSRGVVNINLDINEGEIFGFIGPNGAGKSTTIRILLNLIFPSGGNASILGMDVVRQSAQIKRRIGYVPSDANFYDKMSVEEFLNYCIRFYKHEKVGERVEELCELFELDRERKLTDLSMGNKKKVSIVQSLLHNPEVLILDEPTTGLDPLIQAKFFDLLHNENKKGVTVFFSSHILSEVQTLCKRVAIIREGEVIKVEDIETLRKKQLKKVTLRLKREIPGDFRFTGIETILLSSGRDFSFTYSGDMNTLVHSLTELGIDDLSIEEPGLEEIFLHYYNR